MYETGIVTLARVSTERYILFIYRFLLRILEHNIVGCIVRISNILR